MRVGVELWVGFLECGLVGRMPCLMPFKYAQFPVVGVYVPSCFTVLSIVPSVDCFLIVLGMKVATIMVYRSYRLQIAGFHTGMKFYLVVVGGKFAANDRLEIR